MKIIAESMIYKKEKGKNNEEKIQIKPKQIHCKCSVTNHANSNDSSDGY